NIRRAQRADTWRAAMRLARLLAVQATDTNTVHGTSDGDVAPLEFIGDQNTRAQTGRIVAEFDGFFLVADDEVAVAHSVEERLHVRRGELDVLGDACLERGAVVEVGNDRLWVAVVIHIVVAHAYVGEVVYRERVLRRVRLVTVDGFTHHARPLGLDHRFGHLCIGLRAQVHAIAFGHADAHLHPFLDFLAQLASAATVVPAVVDFLGRFFQRQRRVEIHRGILHQRRVHPAHVLLERHANARGYFRYVDVIYPIGRITAVLLVELPPLQPVADDVVIGS